METLSPKATDVGIPWVGGLMSSNDLCASDPKSETLQP